MDKEKIKIIIADDNLEFATTFEKFLNEEEDMEVVAVAKDGVEAYDKIIDLKPDVVLLDVIMPNLDGIGVLEKLNEGDLGVKDEEGNYRITGRIKDMIIRGGENIYPREIEEFLYQMEGIKDVQVAGIPSKKYGEAVGAFIILHEGVEMNEFDVRDFCDGKIARYKIPKYIFFVDEFPMTGSGKIQKFKLKDVGLELCRKQGIEII